MKASELLKKQHRDVKRMFKQLDGTTAPKQRKKLALQIIDNLKLHTKIEEEVFYPAVQDATVTQKAEDMVLEAYEEHHVVKYVMAELAKCDPAADNFKARATVLKELIEHHVEEEEDEMFPMAEKRFGQERSAEICVAMQAMV